MQSRILCFLLLTLPNTIWAATGNWESVVTGANINYTITEANSPAKDVTGKYITVVYLENLNFNKIGTNSNEADVEWLLSQGYRVIELDYANHVRAYSPFINQDIIKINDEIDGGSFCGSKTCSKYQSYVLFEGYRIARNLPYFVDDPTIYNYPDNYTVGDSLRMDIIYPANPSGSVPVVLSFSYSNSWAGVANRNQRLKLGYTLAGFNDSFLEGAPGIGIAWAIADHPKYCNWGSGKPTGGANDTYKSYEVNPDAAQKVKSAIRTLRNISESLGLSGKIGIYGFSRGSSAGAMAIGDRADTVLEKAGFNIGVSDDVQAAALGSGVFDFTYIYNKTDDGDKNLEVRCPWAWGPLADNRDLWYSMGAISLVESSATAPTLFFYNTDDSPHYQDQIQHFKEKLDTLGVPTYTLIDYATGHAVPQSDTSLSELYAFFEQYLSPPKIILKDTTKPSGLGTINGDDEWSHHNIPFKLFPTSAVNELRILIPLVDTGKVKISLCNLSGLTVFKMDKYYDQIGSISETIHLNELSLPEGVYIVKVSTTRKQGIKKFIKNGC